MLSSTRRRIAARSALTLALSACASLALAAPAGAASYYSSRIALDSPTAYWSLDDAAGASSAVAVPIAANGTYRNRVVTGRGALVACEQRQPWSSSAFTSTGCAGLNWLQGSAAYFDGSQNNPYVDIPSSAVPSFSGQVNPATSFAAWVDPLSPGGTVVDHGNDGILSVNSAGKVVLAYESATGPVAITSTGSIGSGSHYIAGVVDSVSGGRLYVDGFVTTNATPAVLSGQPALSISKPGHPFHGTIDDVTYWNSSVSTATLDSEYAAGQVPDPLVKTITKLTPYSGAKWYSGSPKTLTLGLLCPGTTCSATVDGLGVYTNGSTLPTGVGSHPIVATAASGYTTSSSYTVGSSFANVILNDSPTNYWRFDDVDGAIQAFDTAVGALNGFYENASYRGTIGATGADLSTAHNFRGGDGAYLGVNDIAAKANGFTIEGWILPADGADMAIFDHGASGGGPALFISAGKLVFQMPGGSLVQATLPVGYTKASQGAGPYTFTHVAASWDGVTARLYINGASVGTPVEVAQAPSGTPALYVGFGNVGLGTPNFHGLIDEVSYFGSALSAERINEHYLADPPAVVTDTSTQDIAAAPASSAPVKAVEDSSAAPAAKAAPKPKAKPKAKAKAKHKAHRRAKAKAKHRAKRPAHRRH